MPEKLFTPAEANRTLPLVRRIVTDILAKGKLLRETASPDEPETVERADRVNVLEAELEDLFHELAEVGCSFRDWSFEMGLVDFPGEIDGKPVLLCWRSDEPEVRFYHTHEGGYAGRRPIPDRLLEARRA
ncbi:DUF2203 domain-containing protein [bacterium]|nr:DUF2203 domain-containing protein [bacterium]